jgi:hypothetical protein
MPRDFDLAVKNDYIPFLVIPAANWRRRAGPTEQAEKEQQR